jgi:hypothetical protein
MNEEVELLYKTLKETAEALDYCGDSWERSCTGQARNKAANVLDEFEKKYELGAYTKENQRKSLHNRYFRCPWCDKEHLKTRDWITGYERRSGGSPGKYYYELIGLIEHAKIKHDIKQKDKPKEFETREDWFLSILTKKQEELELEQEKFVDED